MPAVYENLEIELSRCCCGQREVRILESPVDRPRAKLAIDDSDLAVLRAKVDRLDALILKKTYEHRSEARALATEVGRQLFELVAPGRVGNSLRESLRLLEKSREERDVGSRLRFSFGQGASYDPQLATLPWELICDPETGDRFLAGDASTQMVRYLEISRKIKPLAAASPLRILAILASPTDQPEVDLKKQELSLRHAIDDTRGALELKVLKSPTLREATETLAAAQSAGRPFHVLHFLGHGELTAEGDGALYFETRERTQHVVRSQVLANQIAQYRDLRLVLLATCSGARLPRRQGQNPFTGSASALIAANIPAVVAMQFNVSEDAAAGFTNAFYSQLAERRPLDEAVAQGRLRIMADDVDGLEWATPVLFLRSPSGVIFKTPRAVAETAPARSASQGSRQQKMSLNGGHIGGNATLSQVAGDQQEQEVRDAKIGNDLNMNQS